MLLISLFSIPETTYNFEVADYHTYYVGECNVLVHNMCGKKPGNAADDGLQFESKAKLEEHFAKHGKEFGGMYQTADEYLAGANYVIKNGTYVPEMNGFIMYYRITSKGKTLYHFVGLKNGGTNISTYFTKPL